MSRPVLVALRVLLVLLFAGSVTAQVLAPSIAAGALRPVAAVMLAALAIGAIVCVEIVLVSVWMLLGMVRDQRIFDEDGHSDRWVNATIGALVAAAAIAAGSFVFILLSADAGSAAGTTVAIVSATVAGACAALALLVVVMRQLLHTAIALHSELAEVV
jgi:hypothetical protein